MTKKKDETIMDDILDPRELSRQRRRSRMRDADIEMGACCGSLPFMFVLVLVGVFSGHFSLIFLSLGILVLVNFFPWRKSMKALFSKLLGWNVTRMKVDAIANYLKVRFLLVPEHYECEDIETKK